MDTIPELTRTEKQLKELYLRFPDRKLDLPSEQEDVMDILLTGYSGQTEQNITQTMKPHVDESIFIHNDMDVSFLRHARYSPAFWHNHDFFEMIYVYHGNCMNYLFDQKISMQSGDICIMAPNVMHAISAFHDSDIILNILIRKSTFEKSFLGLLDENTILADFFRRTFYQTSGIPYLCFHTGNDEFLFSEMDQIYEESQNSRRYQKQMVNTLLSLFFIHLFRRHEQHIEISNLHLASSDEDLMFILRYMQANYATVSLKELSSIFNYSERQLQRIITNATGHTFLENIQHQKLKRVTDLLTESPLSITEICELSGFQSLNNFRKIFYRYYQMTPSEYRQKFSHTKEREKEHAS